MNREDNTFEREAGKKGIWGLRIFDQRIDSRGSAAVEAALAVPVFLMAVCALFCIGQLLLVGGEVYYSLVQTARTCADEEVRNRADSSGTDGEGDGNRPGGDSHGESGRMLWLKPQSLFMAAYDGGALCETCIAGGRGGVLVSGRKISGTDSIRLTARYVLRVPVFLFRPILLPREITIEERIFSGYYPRDSDRETEKKDEIVFVTKRGTVYHRRADCTHICLSIKNADAVREIIRGGRYRPCDKCIRRTGNMSVLYITAEGDCYHSRLSCSGLKRTVRAVYLSEIPGVRPCSRCSAGR